MTLEETEKSFRYKFNFYLMQSAIKKMIKNNQKNITLRL